MFSRNNNAPKYSAEANRSRSSARGKGTPAHFQSLERRRSPSRFQVFPILCVALLTATFCSAPVKTVNGMPIQGRKGGNTPSAGISVSTAPTFSSPGLMITTELGGTAEFRVVLDSQPTANVTINLTSSKPTEGDADAPWLTFTPNNWNTPQTVIVTGEDDLVDDGTSLYFIDIEPAISEDPNYDGINASDVWLSNVDNELPVTNAIYVRSFEMETRPKGRGTEIRLSIDVRHDTDDDVGAYGESEDSDPPAAGAVVVISIYDSIGTNIRNFVGTTGDQGTGTTAWYKLPGTGDYYIEVHDVSLDGFYWDPLDELDGFDPFRGIGDWDDDGRPDLLLSI